MPKITVFCVGSTERLVTMPMSTQLLERGQKIFLRSFRSNLEAQRGLAIYLRSHSS